MPSALKAQAKDVFQRMSSVESQESDSICHGQSTTPKKQTLPKGLGPWGGGGDLGYSGATAQGITHLVPVR